MVPHDKTLLPHLWSLLGELARVSSSVIHGESFTLSTASFAKQCPKRASSFAVGSWPAREQL